MPEPVVVRIGLDGAAAPVGVREAWALGADDKAALYAAAVADGLGACLVSTCFRVELLVAGEHAAERLLAWGRRQLRAARPDAPLDHFREATGDDALRHLIRVAAGLESAVLGEAQILGQVRRARAEAQKAGALTPELRAALSTAVRAGTWIRRTTGLGRGAASTASAAVRLAEGAGLEGRDVLVVGGGQMGRLLLSLLPGARPASVTLVSAHAPEHAGFRVVRPDALADALPDADVVFTAASRQVLDAEAARAAWADGPARTVVDLGVPRNVDPEVGAVEGVTVHDIDALGAVVDAGLQAREAAVPEAEALVEEALDALADDFEALRRERLVGDVRRRAERGRRETLDYVCGRCNDRTCEPAEGGGPARCSDPDRLTRTLTNRLFHDLTAALRERPADLDEGALRRLFALDDA
jgi:glutamyl-tRNA reductase